MQNLVQINATLASAKSELRGYVNRVKRDFRKGTLSEPIPSPTILLEGGENETGTKSALTEKPVSKTSKKSIAGGGGFAPLALLNTKAGGSMRGGPIFLPPMVPV